MVKKKNEDVDIEIDKFIDTILNQSNQKTSPFTESIKELKSKSFGIKRSELASIIKYIEMFKSLKAVITEEVLNVNYKEFIDNYYDFIAIIVGDRKWMEYNLTVDTFRNGEPIPHAENDEQWEEAGKTEQPAWCWPTDDPDKRKEYGKLYNHYAVADPRGLAPDGWHIPAIFEFEELIIPRLKGKRERNGVQVSIIGPLNPKINLPLAGRRTGGFGCDEGKFGYYWSRTKCTFDYDSKDFSYLHYDNKKIDLSIGGFSRAFGFSVRCLKDLTPQEKTKNRKERIAQENKWLEEKKKIDEEKKRADEGIRRAEQKKKAEEEGWLIVKIIIGLLIAILLWVIF